MRLIVTNGADAAGQAAAELLAERITRAPKFRLGVATGSSPGSTYRHLAALLPPRPHPIELFALDEYIGLPRGHAQSYEETLKQGIASLLNLDLGSVHVPDAWHSDPTAAGLRYDALLANHGGIDLQILGIGANGHIGFNEPFSEFGSRTRRVALTEETRRANSRFFATVDQVPTYAMTQGISNILAASAVLLIATGQHKADALVAAIEGPIAWACPASALQLHRDVTVVCDSAAASSLTQTIPTPPARRQGANNVRLR